MLKKGLKEYCEIINGKIGVIGITPILVINYNFLVTNLIFF